jgi:hypothetical protein
MKAADHELLNRLMRGDNSTRCLMEANFCALKTEMGREQYVFWLSRQMLMPEGEWPNGHPPNLGDAASSMLAKLEHRWRGLDR